MMVTVMYAFWICPSELAPGSDCHPGDDSQAAWQQVGFIDPVVEGDLVKLVQQHLGLKGGAIKSTKGYVSAYKDEPWVQEVLARHPSLTAGFGAQDTSDSFWVAIDVSTQGDGIRYLRTTNEVKFTNLSRRPPEPHPGNLKQVVPLPIQIRTRDGSAFTKSWEPA